MTTTHLSRPTGLTAVVIRSIGVRHPGAIDRIGEGVDALYVDLSEALHNPADDAAMRYLTGLDETVRAHVLSTPDAWRIITRTAAQARALLDLEPRRLVRVTISCRGGRHRSVVAAEAVGELLAADGIGVEVDHEDIGLDVLPAA